MLQILSFFTVDINSIVFFFYFAFSLVFIWSLKSIALRFVQDNRLVPCVARILFSIFIHDVISLSFFTGLGQF